MKFLLGLAFLIALAKVSYAAQVQYVPQYSVPRGIVAAPVTRSVDLPQYRSQIGYSPINIGLRTIDNPSLGLTQIPINSYRLVRVPVGLSNGIGLRSGLGLRQGFVSDVSPDGPIISGWRGLSGLDGLSGLSGLSGLGGLGGWSELDDVDFIKKKK